MIIDASYLILGRLASYAAKQALLGKKVDIVNCENAIITGNKKWIMERHRKKMQRGIPLKGPYIKRMPDRYVKRAIRGMLPYKQAKGRQAFEKIMCYIGVPEKFKDKKLETLKSADISKVPNLRYTTVKQVCKTMGAKI
jgi:large subunit ribosomal protein L13